MACGESNGRVSDDVTWPVAGELAALHAPDGGFRLRSPKAFSSYYYLFTLTVIAPLSRQCHRRGAEVHCAHQALYLLSHSRYSFTDPKRMEGWVSPGPGCKEQLAHGCYATARVQQDSNLRPWSSTLTTRLSRSHHPRLSLGTMYYASCRCTGRGSCEWRMKYHSVWIIYTQLVIAQSFMEISRSTMFSLDTVTEPRFLQTVFFV